MTAEGGDGTTGWNPTMARQGAQDLRAQGEEFQALLAGLHATLDRWTSPAAPDELREFGRQIAEPGGQLTDAAEGLAKWCMQPAADIESGAIAGDRATTEIAGEVKDIKAAIDDVDADPGLTGQGTGVFIA